MKNSVTVKRKIEKFIPQFLNNTKNDIEALKDSVLNKNFEEMHRMSHSMKGYAKPFGFHYIGELASQIVQAAQEKRLEDAQPLIEELDAYFSTIEIIYE